MRICHVEANKLSYFSPIHTSDADATQLSSWVASAVWTHPSVVVTQFTISCVGEKRRHNDVIVEKVINIDQNSRTQTAMFSFQIVHRIRRQSSWASCEFRTHRTPLTPTRLNSTVEPRRRQRCALSFTFLLMIKSHRFVKESVSVGPSPSSAGKKTVSRRTPDRIFPSWSSWITVPARVADCACSSWCRRHEVDTNSQDDTILTREVSCHWNVLLRVCGEFIFN